MMQGAVSPKVPAVALLQVAHQVETGAWFAIGGVAVGMVLVVLIRTRGWSWSCGLPLLVAAQISWALGWRATIGCQACAFATVAGGAWRHLVDLRTGGDMAQRARERLGPVNPLGQWYRARKLRTGQWVTGAGMVIGFTRKGAMICVRIASVESTHVLVVGATGSGKTVTMVLAALAGIARGRGVVYIDPKGDDFVLAQLGEAAERAGRNFLV